MAQETITISEEELQAIVAARAQQQQPPDDLRRQAGQLFGVAFATAEAAGSFVLAKPSKHQVVVTESRIVRQGFGTKYFLAQWNRRIEPGDIPFEAPGPRAAVVRPGTPAFRWPIEAPVFVDVMTVKAAGTRTPTTQINAYQEDVPVSLSVKYQIGNPARLVQNRLSPSQAEEILMEIGLDQALARVNGNQNYLDRVQEIARIADQAKIPPPNLLNPLVRGVVTAAAQAEAWNLGLYAVVEADPDWGAKVEAATLAQMEGRRVYAETSGRTNAYGDTIANTVEKIVRIVAPALGLNLPPDPAQPNRGN